MIDCNCCIAEVGIDRPNVVPAPFSTMKIPDGYGKLFRDTSIDSEMPMKKSCASSRARALRSSDRFGFRV